ncbi:unnamed protein product [Moneuplotes crassus]|uniref:Uncharacterized protein n=1 Tax=Euplotes crassus TaxID=5936 RepID=A0AAD1Y0U9_EUPCR|nr:unnamed protein product [Moneuplotes crassus]
MPKPRSRSKPIDTLNMKLQSVCEKSMEQKSVLATGERRSRNIEALAKPKSMKVNGKPPLASSTYKNVPLREESSSNSQSSTEMIKQMWNYNLPNNEESESDSNEHMKIQYQYHSQNLPKINQQNERIFDTGWGRRNLTPAYRHYNHLSNSETKVKHKKVYLSTCQRAEITQIDNFPVEENNDFLNGHYADYDSKEPKTETKTIQKLDSDNSDDEEPTPEFFSKNGTKVYLDRRVYGDNAMHKKKTAKQDFKEEVNNKAKKFRMALKKAQEYKSAKVPKPSLVQKLLVEKMKKKKRLDLLSEMNKPVEIKESVGKMDEIEYAMYINNRNAKKRKKINYERDRAKNREMERLPIKREEAKEIKKNAGKISCVATEKRLWTGQNGLFEKKAIKDYFTHVDHHNFNRVCHSSLYSNCSRGIRKNTEESIRISDTKILRRRRQMSLCFMIRSWMNSTLRVINLWKKRERR